MIYSHRRHLTSHYTNISIVNTLPTQVRKTRLDLALQIDPDVEVRWCQARTTKALRDLSLTRLRPALGGCDEMKCWELVNQTYCTAEMKQGRISGVGTILKFFKGIDQT